MYRVGIHRYKIENKFLKRLYCLRELLLVLWESRAVIRVGEKGGNHVRLILSYQSSWFVRDLAVSFGGLTSGPYS